MKRQSFAMAKIYQSCVALLIALPMLAACETKQRQQNVWDLYDVRYPAPANVPVSRGTYYDRYIDNDAFYTPPTFGSCGSDNIGLGACD